MSDLEHPIGFKQTLSELEDNPDWQRLPDVRLAMWPPQARFSDDLSDESLFSNRFLESRIFVGKIAYVLYLLCGAFWITTIFSLLTITWDVLAGRSLGDIVVMNGIFVLFSILMFALAYSLVRREPVCVRFNRQAQVVHIYRGSNQASTVLWRDVHAFAKFSPSADGKVSLKLIFHDGASHSVEVSGAFDICDELALVDNLLRLEFLRRYMAEGLSAVQPHPDLPIHKPSGFSKAVTINDDGVLTFLFSCLVVLPAYYLAGGPLIDRYLLRRAANLQWPAEVERLCSPHADLSGYDTTPVQAHPDIFYRFNGRGFDLVDIHGNVLG